MNITILCIGKLKESYWKDAVAEYSKRLTRFCKLEITELPEDHFDDKDKESSSILAKLAGESHKPFVIALDVGGNRLSSEDFSEKIEKIALGGTNDICFIIGGSNGFNDSVRKAADMRLSFSDFTFPHQMMRVILLEQIYRAFKISAGEKYHK